MSTWNVDMTVRKTIEADTFDAAWLTINDIDFETFLDNHMIIRWSITPAEN